MVAYKECQGTEENCQGENEQPTNESVNHQSTNLNCSFGDWSEFGECSQPCGKGKITRTREYLIKRNQNRCQNQNPEELEEHQVCEGQNCSGDITEEKQPNKKVNSCYFLLLHKKTFF